MKTTTWIIDPMHSEIQFKVKQLVKQAESVAA